MKKVLKCISLSLLVVFGATTLFLSTGGIVMAATTTGNEVCNGIMATGTEDCEDNGAITALVKTIISIFSWIVGVVCVIMVIYGGFRYVTSGGDSNNIAMAKNTILYALIGLVIVALAQVIVKFVLNKATSAVS
ncbi:MAG: pilin [Candidatus Saccharibacteria bacterium]